MGQMNDIFKAESIIRTITLCAVTFGLYVIYRLFRLTNQVNGDNYKSISSCFVICAISVHLAALFSLAIFFTAKGSPELLVFSKFMHLVSSVFHVAWLIKIRNKINSITGAGKGSRLWLDPILSSFFHVIYIQYKINQLLQVNARHSLQRNTV